MPQGVVPELLTDVNQGFYRHFGAHKPYWATNPERLRSVGFPVMKNQMDKHIKHEMETWVAWGPDNCIVFYFSQREPPNRKGLEEDLGFRVQGVPVKIPESLSCEPLTPNCYKHLCRQGLVISASTKTEATPTTKPISLHASIHICICILYIYMHIHIPGCSFRTHAI